MEIDYERLDINQCPIGDGNPPPNFFANTARCHNDTTDCEPIHGYGFRRGGYQCLCKPGFRLPKVQRTAFKGEQIERATRSKYKGGFSCERIGYVAVRTQNILPIDLDEKDKLVKKIQTLTGIRSNSSTTPRIDPNMLIEFMRKINPNNCGMYRKEDLVLRGDVAYGKEFQLENQARMALRLANFLSSFLQVVDPKEQFAEFRIPDKPLTKDQVIGEALAAMIGDHQVLGVGVIFEPHKFNENITDFAPYAYRLQRNARDFRVDDLGRFPPDSSRHYQNKDFYKKLRVRWSSMINMEELETYTTKINMRFNSNGYNLIRYDRFPLQYRAAELRHGLWSSPYYDCGGFHNQWKITYTAPFFGWDSIKSRLELKGLVFVDMQLEELDINQCGYSASHDPDATGNTNRAWATDSLSLYANMFPLHRYASAANAFRNTHKCDRLSSRCVPILGRRFDAGGYRCECEQGFEYPFNDGITYYDGQILEAEYLNMLQNRPSRFDTLACRIAGAPPMRISLMAVLTAMVLSMITLTVFTWT